MASSAAENAVKKLARWPSNTVCPNCGTQRKFGFSTVCIKYLTFVCNNCKSSHQAISHRCKSLTMSSWTEGEVLQLKTHGNDHARSTWLARAPPPGQGGRPKEGDNIDIFKAFIVDTYEHKRYFSERAGGSSMQLPSEPSHPAPIPARSPPTQPKPPLEPSADVDFFSFDTMASRAPASAASFDAFGSSQAMPFNAFGSSQPAPSQVTQAMFDPFTASTPSSAVPLAGGPTTLAASPGTSFDPFGTQSNAPTGTSMSKAPVMSNTPAMNMMGGVRLMNMNPSNGMGMMDVTGFYGAPSMTATPQQQAMFQQQMSTALMQQQRGVPGMMPNSNNGHTGWAMQQPVMMMNNRSVNSISSNFGAQQEQAAKKPDPFAGLGL